MDHPAAALAALVILIALIPAWLDVTAVLVLLALAGLAAETIRNL